MPHSWHLQLGQAFLFIFLWLKWWSWQGFWRDVLFWCRCSVLCLIRKQVNHGAGSNTFCTSTSSGTALQNKIVKYNTYNLSDIWYLRRSKRIECIEVISLSSRPFYCCASDASFLPLCTNCTLTGILIYNSKSIWKGFLDSPNAQKSAYSIHACSLTCFHGFFRILSGLRE